MNIEKQFVYWKASAEEDMQAAEDLLQRGRIRHALFFAHLALEKILKAHVVAKINDLAPRIHNLSRLREIGGLELGNKENRYLNIMNAYNQIGRYPEEIEKLPDTETASLYIREAREVLTCLSELLKKA